MGLYIYIIHIYWVLKSFDSLRSETSRGFLNVLYLVVLITESKIYKSKKGKREEKWIGVGVSAKQPFINVCLVQGFASCNGLFFWFLGHNNL